jgi:hypothetical protein
MYLSNTLGDFAKAMNSVYERRMNFEDALDVVRRSMHILNSTLFPFGRRVTSIDRIASTIFPSKIYGTGKQHCNVCS